MARPESRNETKPSTLKSSEKARLALEQLQPRPPSSPAHNEQSRSAGRPERGFKRCFKNKMGDKAAADSVQVKKGSDGSSGSSIVPRADAKGEQPSQEHSAARTTLLLPNMSKDPEGEPASERCTVAAGTIPHPSSHRHEDNREEKEGGSQESGAPGAAAGDRAQVRQCSFKASSHFCPENHLLLFQKERKCFRFSSVCPERSLLVNQNKVFYYYYYLQSCKMLSGEIIYYSKNLENFFSTFFS